MSKRARKEPSKAEVNPWNGKECAEARNTKLASGEKIAGREFSLCLEYNLQRLQSKQEELAEEGCHHERSDKENKINRKHGCKKPLAGPRSCLRKIVRKHGPTGWEDTMHKWYEWLGKDD